jgi:hypothetical protein
MPRPIAELDSDQIAGDTLDVAVALQSAGFHLGIARGLIESKVASGSLTVRREDPTILALLKECSVQNAAVERMIGELAGRLSAST